MKLNFNQKKMDKVLKENAEVLALMQGQVDKAKQKSKKINLSDYSGKYEVFNIIDTGDISAINKLAQGRVDKANKDFSVKEGYDLTKIGSNLWWVKS